MGAADRGTPAGHRIAIIGMAGRFPGAVDLDQFWQNLVEGVESLTELDTDRLQAAGVTEQRFTDPNYVRLVPLLDDIEGFDAKYFGYHAREAQVADPQQRIFLEVCNTALQHAGYDPSRYPGRIGVFGGGAPNTYSHDFVYENQSVRDAVGDIGIEINNAPDYLATRVAYTLGLTGPAVSVVTACSTALVAVHLACRSLTAGECSMAIAGAVNIRTPQEKGYTWAENSIYSRDGHIRTFDAEASGTNFGYGAGTVLLKRYEDAVADGDTVHAVIIGSAMNNDGANRASFGAPSPDGQTVVISDALRDAGDLDPDTIGYVEAHGTGTAVGDPIEVEALSTAYRHAGARGVQAIPIGSVKTNIGHLGAAAGIPSLIKVVLAIQHRRLPATLHYSQPNPRIPFAQTPFHVCRHSRPWPHLDAPLRAGVSSFGIGGTNAHVILEEPPPVEAAALTEPAGPGRAWQLLPLSAKTATALEDLRSRTAEHLGQGTAPDLADAAFTLQLGRPELAHRAVAICGEGADAAAALRTAPSHHVPPRTTPDLVFLFPGQGAQRVGMAADLYRTEPVFREAFDTCVQLAAPHLDGDLAQLVLGLGDASVDELSEQLRQTRFTQPALFTVEYALARLLEDWGVQPTAMVGHSVGEIVAACLSGVFSLPAAVEFVAVRGRLIQSMPPGGMLALPLSEADVLPILPDSLSIASINGPHATVVAGPRDELEDLHQLLARTGTHATMLQTSHAFHSAMLDPMLDDLRAAAERAEPKPPARRFVSTVTGDWITDEQACSPDYWARQARLPVRFADAVRTVATRSAVFLEVGPGHSLATLVRGNVDRGDDITAVSATTGTGRQEKSQEQALAEAVGHLWTRGIAVDWSRLHTGSRRRRVPLPSYPYERERFWVQPDPPGQHPVSTATGSTVDEPSSDDPLSRITFLPSWRQRRCAPPPTEAAASGPWLVFTPGHGPAEEVAQSLLRRGNRVVRVSPGPSFADLGDEHYQVSSTHRPDYEELLQTLDAIGARPTAVVHGWTATPPAEDSLALDQVHAVRDAGFTSALCLSQAIAIRWPGASVAMRLLTSNGADVTGTDVVEPARALLHGPGRVVPIELETVSCQLVDLPADEPVDLLLQELLTPIRDRTIAFRGGRRWVLDYEPAVGLPAAVTLPHGLRRRGVYLVTGGLGDLGLRIAEELARTAGARLVLVGRTPLPDRDQWEAHLADHGPDDRVSTVIARVTELERLGAELITCAADVADEASMRQVVEQAHERFGPINGVFHAAGVPGGGLVAMKGREQAEAVLRPKVDGTLVLDRLLREECDLFVLFSSIIAVTGGYGQVDYCAANSFLDAFAQSRTGDRAQVLTVNWCGWQGIGMLAGELRQPASSPTPSPAPSPVPATSTPAPAGRALWPLLGTREPDEDRIVFTTTIGPDWHWVLAEHRMGGQQVFPGTSYVEMITSACREATGGEVVEVRDLIFSQPLAVESPRELRVLGEPRDEPNWFSFSVFSRSLSTPDAPWERHATASAGMVDPDGDVPRRALDEIVARCQGPSWNPDLTDPQNIVVFGPHWQVIESVTRGEAEQVARLALPAGTDEDAGAFAVHPSLLDAATALSMYAPEVAGEGQSFLPIAYDRILVREQLPTRVTSHVRFRGRTGGISSYDVSLLDEDGREVVAIEGFSVRAVDVSGVHAALAPAEAKPSAPTLGLAQEELLIDADEATRLLWRMLDTRREAQYVVTIESIPDKTRRLAGIAARVAAALSSAQRGTFVGAASRTSSPARSAASADTSAATVTERELLPLWEEAFAADHLGLDEDFFELGGNSLVAVQLAVRIRDHFQVNVPGIAVLEYPTVRLLAEFIDSSRAQRAEG